MTLRRENRGSVLLYVMVFGALCFGVVVLGMASYAISQNSASNFKQNREEALEIAEAGISYYRWHLAHSNTDFWDGHPSSTPGPYLHDYEDKDGNVIGHYSLNIVPPGIGSTVVTVNSTGWLDAQPNSKRTLRVRLGFPSLADYAFLTNSEAWIGEDESVHGKFHANGGVRFDGLGDAPVTSAMATYSCKYATGCNGHPVVNGIWGDGGPTSSWSFPVPKKDFSIISVKLAEIKSGAQGNGLYFSPSGKQGWRFRFLNNGTVDVMKVNSIRCYTGQDINSNKNESFCIDANSYGSAINYPVPTSTYIFVDDNVWVDGVVKGRATIGTGVGKNIIINGNITYAAKDGSNVLGLVAEQNVLIPYSSPDVLEINAAMLAQNGATKRYYYNNNKKTKLTTYGAILTNGTWTWTWVNNGGEVTSGYETTVSTYDVNLTYNPPSGFPVGSTYNVISWEEVK